MFGDCKCLGNGRSFAEKKISANSPAEREGFEPPKGLTALSEFQVRRIQPLCHLSGERDFCKAPHIQHRRRPLVVGILTFAAAASKRRREKKRPNVFCKINEC